VTRTTPHPGFLPGDQVALQHELAGTLRLVVSHTETGTSLVPWVVCTMPDGSGRYRRPATDLARGWGN